MDTDTETTLITSEFTPVNGKIYPMWQGIVAKKADFIGGRLIEHDNHTGDAEVIITDMRFEPNGDDSAMICIDGKEWGMSADVKYAGITGRDGIMTIHSRFGTSWEVHPK